MSEGLKLGPFELDRIVGQGGMGVIYRGRHVAEELPVAVKVLTVERAREKRFQDAFRLEVETLARMNHPGIATVLDVGRVHDASVADALGIPPQSPWLAMEFVEGEILPRPIGRDAWRRTKSNLLQLLDALAHAHALGVVHRDLKPSNVLVTDATIQRVKLVDFGIALAVDTEHEPQAKDDDAITITGTPRFMAPEQILGEWRDQGPWTDLYALGCIAWWMTTGHSPFEGPTTRLLNAHLHDPVPQFESRFVVPAQFESWLRRLLMKSPVNRYRRAADAAHDLLRMPAPPDLDLDADAYPAPDIGHDTTVIGSMQTTMLLDAESLPSGSPASLHEESGALVRSGPPPIPPLADDSIRQPASTQLLGAGLGLYGLRVVPVVDRSRERTLLWDTLREARTRKTTLLAALRGPAGYGKSRLAEWLARRGHEMGALTTLHATHSEFGGPHDGLGGMLARHFKCNGLDWTDCFARMREVLDAMGFEDAEVLYDAAGFADMMVRDASDRDGRTGFDGPRERNVALRRLFERLAGDRTLLLWLDDAQWAQTSLSFVEFLLEHDDPLPLVILITCRDDGAEDGYAAEDLEALLGAHPRRVLDVGPLGHEHQKELVERLLRLEPEVAAHVTERTEGNPLFAVQLVGDWVERNLLEVGENGFVVQPGATLDVPDDVHELWRGRVERILQRHAEPEAGRIALEIAAALGKDITHAEWHAALDVADVPRADELVEALHRQGLIHRAPDGWAFAHGMLHESVVRTAREESRWAQHHLACAEALRQTHPVPGRHVVRRIAEHLLAGDDKEGALEPLFQAALQARRAGENREAAALLERREWALDALFVPREDRRRAQNLWVRTAIAQESGRPDEARDLVRRAMEISRQNGWNSELGQALRLHGNLLRDAGEFEQSLKAYDEAGEVLAETDDVEAMAQNHVSRAGTHLMRGELQRARAELERAFVLFERVQNDSMRAKTRHHIGYTWIAEGALERATDDMEAALELARDANNRALEANCWNNLGEIARAGLLWDDARDAYREAARLWELSGNRDAGIARLNMAMVEVAAGRVNEARPVLDELETSFMKSGFAYAMPVVRAAQLCCEAGDERWDAWDRRLQQLVGALEETQLVEKDVAWLTERAGDQAAALGEPDRAVAALEIARDQWARLGSEREASAVRGRLDALR